VRSSSRTTPPVKRTEYGIAPAQPRDVDDAITYARAIVAAVKADLAP
jgi:hypothetical protein